MRPKPWQSAASHAARCHDHQYRDDGRTPYVSHPARVALTVCAAFGCTDEAALAAALLHDAIERGGQSYDDLKEECGAEVAGLVAPLSKNMIMPERERERDYLDRLKRADWRARLIKLADVFDNYLDVLTGVKKRSPELRQTCREIIAIAGQDKESHPEIRRAITLLNALLKRGRL